MQVSQHLPTEHLAGSNALQDGIVFVESEAEGPPTTQPASIALGMISLHCSTGHVPDAHPNPPMPTADLHSKVLSLSTATITELDAPLKLRPISWRSEEYHDQHAAVGRLWALLRIGRTLHPPYPAECPVWICSQPSFGPDYLATTFSSVLHTCRCRKCSGKGASAFRLGRNI